MVDFLISVAIFLAKGLAVVAMVAACSAIYVVECKAK